MDQLRPDRRLIRWLPGLALIAAGLFVAYLVITVPIPQALLMVPWVLLNAPILSIPLIAAIVLMIVFKWGSRREPK